MQGELEEALAELKAKEEGYRRAISESAQAVDALKKEQEALAQAEKQKQILEQRMKVRLLHGSCKQQKILRDISK